MVELPSIACPLPQALDHATARKHFDDVKRDMPGLSQAAWRREAARRAGVDYDTFLRAWKKPGAVERPPSGPTKPPTGPVNPPEPPPVGGVTITTRAEARAFERKIAKEKGLKPGTAESRKAAADAAGMRYDDFLGIWKGEKPNIPVNPRPDPIPAGPRATPTPKPAPDPVAVAGKTPTPTSRGVYGLLGRNGFKRSTKTKEKFTHTGQQYGGGVRDTRGVEVREIGGDVYINYRPGIDTPHDATQNMRVMRELLEREGYVVRDGSTRLELVVSKRINQITSTPGPVRRLRSYNGKPKMTETLSDKLVRLSHGKPLRDGLEVEINDQMEYAGTLGDSLRGVKYITEDRIGGVTDPRTIAYYRPGSFSDSARTIYLGKPAHDVNGAYEQLRMERTNWFSRCTHDHGGGDIVRQSRIAREDSAIGIRSTFAHEFGHFIDDMTTSGRTEAVKLRLYDAIADDLGVTREDFMRWRYGADRNPDVVPSVRAAVTKLVSRYGSSNSAEMFAEIWAEYTRNPNGARAHIKKWGTMIQDILEEMQ